MLILTEGTGQWIRKRMRVNHPDYASPVGAAFLFSVLELFYMPVMLLHLSSSWIRTVTLVVFSFCFVLTLLEYKETFHALWKPRSLYFLILIFLLLFVLARYDRFISDLSELQVMALNADTAHCQLGDMRLQGYALFGSTILYFSNMDITRLGIVLTLYTSCIGAMLVLNIIQSFSLKNPWFRFTLILFFIFYEGFSGWRLTEGVSGEEWRLLFIALFIFTVYKWLKNDAQEYRKYIPFILMAGLFTNNGFLMISIELIYCTMVYLLHIQKIRSLYDTITFLFPVVIYLSAWLTSYTHAGAAVLLAVYCVLMGRRHFHKPYLRIIKAENFLIAYNVRIFYIAIPVIFLVGTFILRFFVPGYGIQYGYYIHYFSHHYVNGFLFPKGDFIDIILDIFRWAGLIVFLVNGRSIEDRMVKNIFLCMLVFFVNPLCMGMLLEITGLDMYAGAFEILFNPFTEAITFVYIYRLFEWTVIGQWILELVLVFAVLFGHLASLFGMNMGLYSNLIEMSIGVIRYECIRLG